jgi:hypothetical protein
MTLRNEDEGNDYTSLLTFESWSEELVLVLCEGLCDRRDLLTTKLI